MDKANRIHNNHCKQLAIKPHKYIGLEGKVMSTEEANIFDERGIMMNRPDGLIFAPNMNTIYHIEYKTHGQRNKAYHQLQIRQSYLEMAFLRTHYDRVVGLYVHDNNIIEKV